MKPSGRPNGRPSDLVLLLERKKAILASRENLISFARYMTPDPTHRFNVAFSQYEAMKHHRVIAAGLEELEARRIRKLMISCPPRHGKTKLASILFPAWYVGRHLSESIIVATYNEIYAGDLGRAVRDVMVHPLYKHVFPEVELKYGGASSLRIQTEAGGEIFFTGLDGTLTGRGGHVILIDDPIKSRKEADSALLRERAWEWYTNVLRTRAMTEDAVIGIIATRWHDDDIIGRHLDPLSPFYNEEEATSWHVINLPALAGEDDPLGREEGEPLWEGRFGVEFLEGMRRNDPRGFTALYQCRPTPAEGTFFKNDFIRTYQRMSDLPVKESLRFYGASDLAVSTKQANDKTCLMIIGVDQEDSLWLMPDIVWARMPSNIAVERMIRLMEKYKPLIWWAEAGVIGKSIGPFLRKRMLEERVFCAIDEITPVQDKLQRAQSINSRCAMGKVFFPGFTRWWAEAKEQMLKFPRGSFDDFVDALSLVGLGLLKQVPARLVKKPPQGPRPMTLAWVKELSKKDALDKRTSRSGWL